MIRRLAPAVHRKPLLERNAGKGKGRGGVFMLISVAVSLSLLWGLVHRSGAGSARASSPSSESPSNDPLIRGPAGASFQRHGRVAQRLEQRVATEPSRDGCPSRVSDAGSIPALASLLAEYEWGTPAEAIAWITLDGWEQPEFLELTEDEARVLLALDDSVGFRGPGLLTAVAGPLPTREDCELAARSQAVQDALRDALGWNSLVVELGSVPLRRRTVKAAGKLEAAVRAKDEAELALMKELEDATGQEWRLWWRLYRRWSE